MHHFERLVYQVNAKLSGYQSGKIELYLPRLSQGNFTLRTKILVKYQAHEIGELKFFTKEIDKTVLYLNGYPITTQLADEKAIIDINQQLLDKAPEQPGYIQYISLHYEYTDPTGHFTSDESRVYNDDRPHTKEPLAQRWWYKMPKLT
ncbi:hypothetical protein [Kangiella sp.]|uniref:hypothetical protein n=1 Tax=Kangiella sp. TaxID=1920245 RepID=UPI0019984EA2|nr:hypothetical protein [Kangiella sp.]MBD3652586.1 hypothetical protein [Kangiella sp.]